VTNTGRQWSAWIFLALAALGSVTLAARAHADDGLDLARLRGKVVYLDFWASWCKPCRESFPWMNGVQATYAKQGVVVLAVNVDRARALADAFLEQYPAQFQVYYDPAGKLAENFHVMGMPSSFLIDRSGTVRYRHVGFRVAERDQVGQELQRLVAER